MQGHTISCAKHFIISHSGFTFCGQHTTKQRDVRFRLAPFLFLERILDKLNCSLSLFARGTALVSASGARGHRIRRNPTAANFLLSEIWFCCCVSAGQRWFCTRG
jgi:hypothetical protein